MMNNLLVKIGCTIDTSAFILVGISKSGWESKWTRTKSDIGRHHEQLTCKGPLYYRRSQRSCLQGSEGQDGSRGGPGLNLTWADDDSRWLDGCKAQPTMP